MVRPPTRRQKNGEFEKGHGCCAVNIVAVTDRQRIIEKRGLVLLVGHSGTWVLFLLRRGRCSTGVDTASLRILYRRQTSGVNARVGFKR